jgi:hypothetical protein
MMAVLNADTRFRLDFSDTDLAQLHTEFSITPQEVQSLFENPRSRYRFSADIFFINLSVKPLSL